jgi:hypothetical protein
MIAARLCRGWTAAILLALAAPAATAAQPRAIPGMRVMLQPPEKFVPAERFPGFQWDSARASIMVTEVQAPFRLLTAGLTAEGLASRGMTLRSADSLTIDGRAARLLAVSQEAAGVTFDKWLVVFGDDSASAIVTATYPQELAPTLSDAMRQAVLSSRWSGTGPADPLEGLGFRFDPGPRLRVAQRVGNSVAINATGTIPNPDPGAPLLVIAPSISEADLSDLEAFARARIAQITQVSGLANLVGERVTIGGAPAYLLEADAVDPESSTLLKVFQAVLAQGSSQYLLVQGFVGADRAHEFLPAFRFVALSLRRTP